MAASGRRRSYWPPCARALSFCETASHGRRRALVRTPWPPYIVAGVAHCPPVAQLCCTTSHECGYSYVCQAGPGARRARGVPLLHLPIGATAVARRVEAASGNPAQRDGFTARGMARSESTFGALHVCFGQCTHDRFSYAHSRVSVMGVWCAPVPPESGRGWYSWYAWRG